MTPIRLKGLGQFGESQECSIRFGWLTPKNGMERLRQVAEALNSKPDQEIDARYFVTKVETDFAQECIVVHALIPEGYTLEQVQGALLSMVPPA